MTQNLRDSRQAEKDWDIDRLKKMDSRVFETLQQVSKNCIDAGNKPTVLSVGEGSGADAQKIYVEKLNAKVTATDATDVMLEFAGKRYASSNIEFVQDTWPDLALLRHRQFDIVISNRVLQELNHEEQKRAIKRAISLTKTGGALLIVYQAKKTREGQFPVDEEAIAASLNSLNAERDSEHLVTFSFRTSDARYETMPALDGSARVERILEISVQQKAVVKPILHKVKKPDRSFGR
jgi:ubiquinone/menaquinone biosynthesis C-methylase UbiE